jgi:MFS family permease
VVGWRFVALYALAFMSSCLVLIAPLLVTLNLKIISLVGAERAPRSLALVAGLGSLLAVFANPIFGGLSDRTTSTWGMRRPWMLIGLTGGSVGIVTVALAPNVAVVLIGWCAAQVFFNALLAVQVAVLPDQVPVEQRGLVSGVLGICVPVAAVIGTLLVSLFTGHALAMFLVPCALGAAFILLFVATFEDRQLAVVERPPWSWHDLLRSFSLTPRRNPDFAWAFLSRFLFVMAYAFLTSYQAFYLLEQLHSNESEVPRQIFLGTVVAGGMVVAASLVGGRLSDRIGRRKVFVLTASVIYAFAMFAVAVASDFPMFLVAVALSGLGFGIYIAVDLALVTEVLPNNNSAAKDLGVFNIASALPYSVAPAVAPAVLVLSDGDYTALYVVAGVCALAAAAAILPVKRVR